jgi:hypothetical protein
MTIEIDGHKYNTLLERIMQACVCEAGSSEETKEAQAEINKLVERIEKAAEAVGMTIHVTNSLADAILALNIGYAEYTFKRACQLRGNPDLLAELVDRG